MANWRLNSREDDKRYIKRGDEWRVRDSSAERSTMAQYPAPPKGHHISRSAKTGRVERALSSASKKTGAFKSKKH